MNNVPNIPASVVYNYTGYNINAGGGINYQQLGVGVTSIALGLAIAKLGGMVGRMIH